MGKRKLLPKIQTATFEDLQRYMCVEYGIILMCHGKGHFDIHIPTPDPVLNILLFDKASDTIITCSTLEKIVEILNQLNDYEPERFRLLHIIAAGDREGGLIPQEGK